MNQALGRLVRGRGGRARGYPQAQESDSSSEVLEGVELIVEPVSGIPGGELVRESHRLGQVARDPMRVAAPEASRLLNGRWNTAEWISNGAYMGLECDPRPAAPI